MNIKNNACDQQRSDPTNSLRENLTRPNIYKQHFSLILSTQLSFEKLKINLKKNMKKAHKTQK